MTILDEMGITVVSDASTLQPSQAAAVLDHPATAAARARARQLAEAPPELETRAPERPDARAPDRPDARAPDRPDEASSRAPERPDARTPALSSRPFAMSARRARSTVFEPASDVFPRGARLLRHTRLSSPVAISTMVRPDSIDVMLSPVISESTSA